AGYAWSEDINLIGYINWETMDFAMSPVDEFYVNEGFGYKEMDFTFGIGANITVNDDNMVLFAIEPFSTTKIEPSGYTEGFEETWEVKYRAMPRFILALESDITDWLTFRTGCSKDLGKASWKWEDADETEEEEWTDVDWYAFQWNLGLGFHFGDFDIDCVLNKNIPLSMGYWLTGYQPQPSDEMTPIGMVSAVYSF
ncbi:MAG TPA: hypothetical protein VLA34_12220, partial [Candidatus Krumholzibacterium sp.]|nr:hypothetical protein [Candidatus Krumholzibacterium sp.]